MKRAKTNILIRAVALSLVLMALPAILLSQGISQSFLPEPLHQRISKLARMSGEMLTFDANNIKEITAPAFNAQGATLQQALHKSLEGTGYTYQKNGNTYTIYKVATSPAHTPTAATATQAPATKEGTLHGTILDSDGQLIPGASIYIKELGRGTASNLDGEYTLTLPAGTYTVLVSYIGFQTQEVTTVRTSALHTPRHLGRMIVYLMKKGYLR